MKKWLILLLALATMFALVINCSSGDDDDDNDSGDDDDDATSTVAINEVLTKSYDGPDWIELYNGGSADVDISNWALRDDQDRDPYIIPAGTVLKAGEFLAIDQDDSGETGFSFGLGSEDAVRLFNASENLMDSTQWTKGQVDLDKSWGRIPDGTGEFRVLATPTKGASNEDTCGNGSADGNEECEGSDLNGASCESLGFASGNLSCQDSCDFDKTACVPFETDVIINEVAALVVDTDGVEQADWIELYNPGEAQDLTDWQIRDEKNGNVFTFTSGSSIGSGEYLVIYSAVDGGSGLPFGFGAKDAARLFDQSETIVDETEWDTGQAPQGMSWGRLPNGTGAFKTLETPTPGAENE